MDNDFFTGKWDGTANYKFVGVGFGAGQASGSNYSAIMCGDGQGYLHGRGNEDFTG